MNRTLHIAGILVILLLLAVPRLLDLDATRSPDEDRWMARTAGFTRDLALGQWGKLLKSPTPGITTQWLGSLAIRSESWTLRRLPLVGAQILLILGIGYLLSRAWSIPAGLGAIAALALNPVLLAHTRVFGTDSLLALFLLATFASLFAWRRTYQLSYTALAGVSIAAAALSKLPGVMVIPFVVGWCGLWALNRPADRQHVRQGIAIISASVILTAIVLLPTIAISPRGVLGDLLETFQAEGYTDLHTGGPGYYLRTLIFFSTPLHLAGLAALALAWRRLPSRLRRDIGSLLIAAALFTLMMSLGAKKGDRYLLPVFAALDVVAGAAAGFLAARLRTIPRGKQQQLHLAALIVLAAAAGSLLVSTARLHPHTLAYVNPLTRPWFGTQRHGWGEGLSLAAEYLNQKPDAQQLKVAVYYPNEFSAFFAGEAVPAHQHDEASVDYVVLYRAMLERGPDAWETDVLNHYRDRQPEHIIRLAGLEFIWIYKNQ